MIKKLGFGFRSRKSTCIPNLHPTSFSLFSSSIFVLIQFLSILPLYPNTPDSDLIDSLKNELKKPIPDTSRILLLIQTGKEFNNNNKESAIYFINRSLLISREKKWLKGLALGNHVLGGIYYDNSDYSNSLLCWKKTLDYHKKDKNNQGLAVTLGNIGMIYRKLGNYPLALRHFFESLKKARQTGHKLLEANTLNNLGNTYYNQGDFKLAINYYNLAIKVHEKAGNKKGVASCYGNIGIIYEEKADSALALGDTAKADTFLYPAAFKHYKKAFDVAKSSGDSLYMATWIGNIANIKKAQAEILLLKNKKVSDSLFNVSLRDYHLALSIKNRMGEKSLTCIDRGNIGGIYLLQKNYEAAEFYLSAAFKSADSIGFLDVKKNVSKELSGLYGYKNQWKNAFRYLKIFSKAKDSLFNDEKSGEIGQYEAKHEFDLAEMNRRTLELAEKKINEEKRSRKNLLQYSIVLLLLFVLFFLTFLIKNFSTPAWIIELSVFIPFLVLFEFVLVLTEPTIESLAHDEPIWKLLLNVLIAGILFPIHRFFEIKMKRRVGLVLVNPGKDITIMPLIFILFFVFASFDFSGFHKKNMNQRENFPEIIQPLTKISDTLKIDSLNDLAIKLRDSNPDSSLLLCYQTLLLSEKLSQKENRYKLIRLKRISESCFNMGWIYFLNSDLDSSLKYYSQASVIWKKINDWKGIAAVLANIGNIQKAKGNTKEALRSYFRALEILDSLKDNESVCTALANIGTMYFVLGDYPLSLKYQLKSLKKSEEIGSQKLQSMPLRNIAAIYYFQNNYKKALEFSMKSMKIEESLNNPRGMADALATIGTLYETIDKKKSLEYYFRSLELGKKLNDKQGISNGLGSIAGVYQDIGISLSKIPDSVKNGNAKRNFEKAYHYNKIALDMAIRIDDKGEISKNMANLGANLYELNRLGEAEKILKKALSIADSLQNQRYIQSMEDMLCDVYVKKGNYKLAFLHYENYIKIKDQFLDEEKSREIGKLQTTYQLESDAIQEKKEKEQLFLRVREKKVHRAHIQYGFTFLIILFLFMLIIFSGKLKMGRRFIQGTIFITLLVLFEYLLVLMDPIIIDFTGAEPLYKLLVNIILSAVIFPVDAYLRKKLVSGEGKI